MKNIKLRRTSMVLALLLAALLAAVGCVSTGSQPTVHTVEQSDTLAKIAQAHGTTVAELVELNKASYPSLETNPGAIEVGWKLQVPGGKGGGIKIAINTPSANAGAPAARPMMDRDAFEMEIVRLVNEERVKAGLAPLEVDLALMRFAQERSEDMVAREYFSHYDPVTGEDLSGDAGENIFSWPLRFSDSMPVNAEVRTVSGWMESEGHRNNILDSGATRTGVGIAVTNSKIVVTQLFK